jgi:phosphate transport system permease protein
MTNPPPARSPRTGPFVDRLFGWAAKVLVAILGSLFVGAWPAIAKYGLGFLTSTTWDPVTEEFGGLVMIYGTLMRRRSSRC